MASCRDCIHFGFCYLTIRDEGQPCEFKNKNNLVEVVRCKDCKYWKPGDSFGGDSLDDMQRIGGCPIVRFGRREKDFCCEGERKDNE